MAENLKLNKKELKCFNFEKTFLYKTKDEYSFGEPLTHCLFVSDDKTETNVGFEDYLFDFLNICSLVDKKPSIIFADKNLNNDNVQISLGDNYYKIREDSESELLNQEPCYCMVNSFSGAVNNILLSRYEQNQYIKTFVIVDSLENYDAKKIVPIIKVAHEKDIHFIIHIKNMEELLKNISKNDFKVIQENCNLKLLCK